MRKRVIVIRAGIAGLTVAYRLRSFGFDVQVLEGDSRVGGRMSTNRLNGHVVERGAQFLTTKYHTLMPLIHELGLGSELVATAPFSAVVQGGRPV